jgi:hypothetical protein
MLLLIGNSIATVVASMATTVSSALRYLEQAQTLFKVQFLVFSD